MFSGFVNIWKRRVMKRRLLPQRLALPSAREAHGGDVDGRVSGEQGIDLSLHVVVGRNDVEEILDDAKAEINFPLVDGNGNPRAAHAPLGQHLQCKCAIPYASMMAAVVAGNGDDGHP